MYILTILFVLSVQSSTGLEFKAQQKVGYFNTEEGCLMFADRHMDQLEKLEFYKPRSMMFKCEKAK